MQATGDCTGPSHASVLCSLVAGSTEILQAIATLMMMASKGLSKFSWAGAQRQPVMCRGCHLAWASTTMHAQPLQRYQLHALAAVHHTRQQAQQSAAALLVLMVQSIVFNQMKSEVNHWGIAHGHMVTHSHRRSCCAHPLTTPTHLRAARTISPQPEGCGQA